MRLLIVDDDIELCSLLKEFLEREEYSVQCVNEGREGLEQALVERVSAFFSPRHLRLLAVRHLGNLLCQLLVP